jgi:uncharacterized protein YkwD
VLPALKRLLLVAALLAVLFSFQAAVAQTENPNSQSAPTPTELIAAVNALRTANGLRALSVHSTLMCSAHM